MISKKILRTKSTLLILINFIFSNNVLSQIKIGENPRSINPDAMIEVESSNKGFLLPRVSLKSLSSPTPLKYFTKGMVVYNISSNNEITPGLYYCDGVSWIKTNTEIKDPSSASSPNDFWSLTGNSNISSCNFIGPTNNAALVVKTNNLERLRVTEKGWVGIGTPLPKAALEVKGQIVIDSILAGSIETDKILVANPNDGRVKYIPVSGLTNGVQNYNETVAYNGKTIFSTPSIISDVNKIFFYRNGVLISFSINGNNSIVSEIPCKQGDQIRIIQLL